MRHRKRSNQRGRRCDHGPEPRNGYRYARERELPFMSHSNEQAVRRADLVSVRVIRRRH
jgi:hypothetical protein